MHMYCTGYSDKIHVHILVSLFLSLNFMNNYSFLFYFFRLTAMLVTFLELIWLLDKCIKCRYLRVFCNIFAGIFWHWQYHCDHYKSLNSRILASFYIGHNKATWHWSEPTCNWCTNEQLADSQIRKSYTCNSQGLTYDLWSSEFWSSHELWSSEFWSSHRRTDAQKAMHMRPPRITIKRRCAQKLNDGLVNLTKNSLDLLNWPIPEDVTILQWR